MKIIDDGIGINLSPSSSFQGIGLSTIRERVILIHGRLIIKTKRGTMIKVEVPDDNNFSS